MKQILSLALCLAAGTALANTETEIVALVDISAQE
jgi:hypothetical protein